MILDFSLDPAIKNYLNLLSFHLFYQQMENYCLIICLFESFPYCLLFERKIHFPEVITLSCLVERIQVHLRLDDGNGSWLFFSSKY